MLKDFRDFALKGSLVDMAVGIVLGAAFATVVKSFVEDLLMPIIASLFRLPDFTNLFVILREPETLPEGIIEVSQLTSLEAVREAGGVAFAYGNFLNNALAFILVALALWIVVRQMNKLKKKEAEAEKEVADTGPTTNEILLDIRDDLRRTKV